MKSDTFTAITTDPLNGAPRAEALARARLTAVADFFVRNHAAPPSGLPASTVDVRGLVNHPGPVALAGLPRTSVEATLQCAGNRRCGLIAHRAIPNEVPWGNEAISNAVWEGVSLAAVLDRAGLQEHDTRAQHVWFTGADVVDGKGGGRGFGASIPLAKALTPQVILADTMNGAPLAPDHGAPLRAIVPGYIGARSVKWLTEIRVEREPSDNHFQSAYSIAGSSSPYEGEVLGPLRVNSALAMDDEVTLSPGRHTVRGWAMAGGDATVIRVEVSADGAQTWTAARFTTPEARYVWRLWEADVAVTPDSRELLCRALDSSGASQPERASEVWNTKGYMNNCWHRVRISGGTRNR